jgi:sarcosine oxidase subunit gamma
MADLVLLPPAPLHVLRGEWGGESAQDVTIPATRMRAAESAGGAALWLGPDEWLLIGVAPPDPARAVDVSGRDLWFELSGADACLLLAAGVPLDLHPEAFPPGMCTRTVCERVSITLWRRAPHEWRIGLARSFAPYFRDLLAAIATANGIVLSAR